MKANILAKTEVIMHKHSFLSSSDGVSDPHACLKNLKMYIKAIAEAQAQREISEALNSQLVALRAHVKQQDEALKRQGTMQSVLDQRLVLDC